MELKYSRFKKWSNFLKLINFGLSIALLVLMLILYKVSSRFYDYRQYRYGYGFEYMTSQFVGDDIAPIWATIAFSLIFELSTIIIQFRGKDNEIQNYTTIDTIATVIISIGYLASIGITSGTSNYCLALIIVTSVTTIAYVLRSLILILNTQTTQVITPKLYDDTPVQSPSCCTKISTTIRNLNCYEKLRCLMKLANFALTITIGVLMAATHDFDRGQPWTYPHIPMFWITVSCSFMFELLTIVMLLRKNVKDIMMIDTIGTMLISIGYITTLNDLQIGGSYSLRFEDHIMIFALILFPIYLIQFFITILMMISCGSEKPQTDSEGLINKLISTIKGLQYTRFQELNNFLKLITIPLTTTLVVLILSIPVYSDNYNYRGYYSRTVSPGPSAPRLIYSFSFLFEVSTVLMILRGQDKKIEQFAKIDKIVTSTLAIGYLMSIGVACSFYPYPPSETVLSVIVSIIYLIKMLSLFAPKQSSNFSSNYQLVLNLSPFKVYRNFAKLINMVLIILLIIFSASCFEKETKNVSTWMWTTTAFSLVFESLTILSLVMVQDASNRHSPNWELFGSITPAFGYLFSLGIMTTNQRGGFESVYPVLIVLSVAYLVKTLDHLFNMDTINAEATKVDEIEKKAILSEEQDNDNLSQYNI